MSAIVDSELGPLAWDEELEYWLGAVSFPSGPSVELVVRAVAGDRNQDPRENGEDDHDDDQLQHGEGRAPSVGEVPERDHGGGLHRSVVGRATLASERVRGRDGQGMGIEENT